MMKNKKISAIAALILIIITAVSGILIKDNIDPDTKKSTTADASSYSNSNLLSVYFIDVGQGDCEFIALPDGKCMLIDSGEAENASSVTQKIQNLGYTAIDFLVVTHPHTDHMGAMAEIIENFDIGSIYMPKAESDTRTYENLIDTISDKNMKINVAKKGVNIYSNDNVSIDILAPVSESYDELNNYSAVIKLTYKDSSYLFTGDAEMLSEKEMLREEEELLDSDILKVGHHGSKYSSSSDFLNTVTPDYAIIECGKNNSYNHPHQTALNKLEDAGVKAIYTTAESSDISVVTDGTGNYTIKENCFAG